MHDPQWPSIAGGTRLAMARAAAASSGLLGVVVLVGWGLDLPTLRSIIPGAVQMKANTAIGLIATAASLAMAPARRKGALSWPDVLAAFVLLLGASTLAQYLFGWHLGIDELIVRDTGAAFNQTKGRMSPYSAVAFVALGTGAWSLARTRLITTARIAGSAVIAIGVISIVGYLWNAAEIVTDRFAPLVAINTAVAFLLLGSAILLLGVPDASALPRRSRTRLETLVLGGFVPTVLFVIVGGGLTYESGASFAKAAERVARTLEVRAELGRLAASIADADTTQRNMMLTADPSYERSFASKVSGARHHVARLERLTSDNPAQRSLQAELAAKVDERLAAISALGDVYRNQGSGAARAALVALAQKDDAGAVQSLIAKMDDAESTLLGARLKRFADRRATTLVSLLATFALLAAIFLLLFRAIRHEMLARHRAEEAVQQLNLDLERRIQERTNELSHQRAFLRRVIDLDMLSANGQSRPHRLGMVDPQVEDRLDIGASRPLIENGVLSGQSA